MEIVKDGVSIKSTATYSSDGNRMVSATDATGKTTTYSYNADTNVLEWVKYPEDTDATKTTYTYDSMYRMASAAATTDSGLALSAEYTYADDLLTAIETGSTTYSFGYGDFALRSNVTIGSRTLASYDYTNRNHYLSSLDYGNNDRVEYEYDDLGRVTRQTYEDGATVDYRYDNNGALATVTDSATGGYQVWVPDETVTYNYVYNGDKLSQMTVGSDTLTFIYDASGIPMAVQYNDTTYYYATNIQGDVIAILNTSGTAVVEYAYDAWGDHLSTTGSMAATLGETNPLRYRGYVYDQEYGLYYLSTRCYNPEVGRFLNADAFAATGQGMLGNNMFGYCGNNPVMGYDPTGLVNRRGVALGIGLALLAVATVVATVVTAGAASPLVATVATAVGTAVSAALAESAITTTIGAIKEDPIVYDLTITCGNQRNGCSLVYDYGTNVSDVYLHDGKTSNGAYGTSYSTGFVYNYNKP